jgi:hypothetical protein
MKPLIAAVALITLGIEPVFAQTALVNEALMSLSVLDIIAILFFVPVGLLVADRFIRGRATAAKPDASIQAALRHEAGREGSDRYRQVISELKRRALQPKWLADGRRRSQASETASKSDRTVDTIS